ncbi:glycosyltransferase family 4 protein [Pseudescherichia vulneris]
MNNKICFFINQIDNSGGTERVTTVVANALSKQGYEISILTIRPKSQPFFNIEPSISYCSLDIQPSGLSILNRFKIVVALRKYIKNNRIDTLIAVDSLLAIYTLPATLGCSVRNVCWEHFNFNINLGVKMRSYARYLAGIFADDIIVLSQKDKKIWNEKLRLSRARIHVIYNPTAYPISTRTYKADSKYVLGVGRLCKQKGFDLLLPAWQQLISKHPEWKLVIAGEGPERQQLELQTSRLGISNSVTFLGALPELAEIYADAAIFCFPSRYEGFGLALAEAQAFGIPAIAIDCECGPSEILDSTNGVLLSLDNIDKLPSVLADLIMDKEGRYLMSKSAKQKAEVFSVKQIIHSWDNFLTNKRM